MADHAVSLRDGGTSPPDWPGPGGIRPILGSRLERRAKRILWRLRRLRPAGGEQPHVSDLEAVYEIAASPRPQVRPGALGEAFRSALTPNQALEASFAALALGIGARHRQRIEGLLAFLELCYSLPELDRGAAAMGDHVRRNGAVDAGSAFGKLEYDGGWLAFAAGIRELALAMAPPAAPRERRPGNGPGRPRVVVRLSGGLGNQLFQYAAALAYARRIGARLRLDLANYERTAGSREFLLGRLRVPVRRAGTFEILWTRRRLHREAPGPLDQFLFGDHGSAWLNGYWEDSVYFSDIAPTLKRRFRPRDERLALEARALIERARVGEGPVVGVHLRRGDRGPGGKAHAPFSTLPASYYRQAASRFPEDASFLVFSDTPEDLAWCREHLGLPEGAGVSFGDGRDPVLDMFALAQCDHVILSAGTFSWWAGYLGERPGRRVISPNPLQALSAARVLLPPPMPPQPGWEEITLAPP